MSDGTTRRGFFVVAIHSLLAAMVAALGIPAAAYLFLPPKARREDPWIAVGSVDALAVNSPVELAFRRSRVDGWKVVSEKSTAWVVKQPGGAVVAFGPQCTHLGCAYRWEDSRNAFLCPCHNSLFSLEGQVLGGPAPRPLDRYRTRIEGAKLWLGGILPAGEPRK